MTFNVFSIQGKGLKLNTTQDVAEFCKQLDLCEPNEIRLSGNTFGVEALNEISKHVGNQLKIVKCSDMFTGRLKSEIPLALEGLVKALETQKSLVELDLSDNAFGPAGAKPIMKLLVNNRNIKILRMNNNGLGIEGTRLISEALTKAHELNMENEQPDNLRHVEFGRNRMECMGAGYLGKALALYSESIVHIQMPQNSIRPDGTETLINYIENCEKLCFLDLQDNTFTAKGGKAIAHAFPLWPNLVKLNLGDCLLGVQGGVLVIEALAGNCPKLERIALFFNEINVKGARLIPEMLSNKTSITSLELNGNTFDAESLEVKAIRAALDRLGKGEVLDELDEMEEEDDDEQEQEREQEQEQEQDDHPDQSEKVHQLTEAFSSTQI